ncbi:hypothetical protein Vretimale_304 [Volvox reticuliferus]|uniref:Uncharacterized protein n=1 Tax=Volvox reticuliferus TaxID=1737510 RepID=A0A8J4D380_9CHLO|nr:hypothetical protein Vretifemale_2595 [Volvox reticuliferus]GIL94135.1 hypothetical protein Vretimale_304 [Volvox reticuliferus]
MAPKVKLGPLSEKEKAEFDNIRHDEMRACKDVKKLMRMEAYFRAEGCAPTADSVLAHIRELGQGSANPEMDPEHARLLAEEQARARAEIADWTATQRQTDAALEAASKEGSAGLHDGALPPVRAPVRMPVSDVKPGVPAASQKSKTDSAVGTNVRSGRQYYDLWEKKVEAALAEADRDDSGNATAPAGTAATAASTAGLRRSPELTQRLLELNCGASSAERMCLSGLEKAKGNEHFRAKEYAEAVEHYTLALGLRGSAGEASLFGNRAAAYIKLKMWDAAEQDSSAALEAEPTMLKAYIRRAAARLEMGKLVEAVADCDAALALQPGCNEAAELRARSAKLLQDAGMKRMVIEEVEDDNEDEMEGDKTPPAVSMDGSARAAVVPLASGSKLADEQGVTAPAPGRKRMVVVETDSEDEVVASKDIAASPAAAPQPPSQQLATSAASLAGTKAEPKTAEPSSSGPVQATLKPPIGAPIAAAVKPGTSAPAAPVSVTSVASVDTPAAGKAAAKEAPRPAAPVATVAPAPPLVRAVPPPPPSLDLPPPPSPPTPTRSSQFDDAVEAIKQEGNKEYMNGNFVRASQLYTDALALAPDLATLYVNRSMARLNSGLNAEALRDACQAVALDPNGYKALNKRARAKERLKLWEASRNDMQRCLDLVPPKDDRIRNEVAKELERADANVMAAKERAAARAAAAAARAPQRVTKYKSVTIEEHDDDEEESDEDKPLLAPEEAAEWEDAATRRLPKLRSRAEGLRAEWLGKKDDEAREAYQRELLTWEAAKERAEAAAAAAAAEAEEAAVAAAITAAAIARSAEPEAVSTQTVEEIKNEGNAHLRAHRYQEAEDCYRECLRVDPGNLYVRLNMLVLLNETNRWTEAEAAANEVLELFSASQASLTAEQQQNMRSKVFHRRSLALKSQGRLREALEDLRAAKALLGQSESLDKEMEALGNLIAAEREVPAPTSAGPASAPSTPCADAPAPSAPAITAETAVVAAAQAPCALPSVEPSPQAVVQPARQVPSATVSETIGPAAAAVPAAISLSRSQGTGNVPVRRRMKVQVESDEDEDEGSSPPMPPEKSPVSDALPTVAPTARSAPQIPPQTPVPGLSSNSSAPAIAAKPATAPTQATTGPVPATTAATAPIPTAHTTSTSNIAAASIPADAAATTTASTATAFKSGGGPRAAVVSGDPGDPEEAGRLRDEGNRLYSVGNYVRAMDFYTRSIRACAHNPAAYCNRAFVYLHLHRPADALLDAEAAIEQAGGRYPKAQLRRAFALRELGRITDAMAAIRQLLDASPGDQVLLDEMQRLQHMTMEEKKAAGNGEAAGRAQGNGMPPKSVANGGALAPAPAAAAAAQAPPVRHKIIVEDVSSDSEDEQAGTAAEVSNTAGASSNRGFANGPSVVAAASSSGTTESPLSTALGQSKGSAAADETSKQAANAVASSVGAAAPVPPPSSAASASVPVEAAAVSTVATGSRPQWEAASAKAAAALAFAVATKVPKKPKPPKNAHELEQALKNLAGHPVVQYEYIRSLDPSSYAGVIKANLSVKMVQAFVGAARHALQLVSPPAGNTVVDAGGAAAAAVATPSPGQEDVDFVSSLLENLILVPRFDMTYGLCGKAMKEDMRALLGALAAAGQDVSLLKKSYKV